jgi:large subunit ribosomal protein L13
MKTAILNPEKIQRSWKLVDADGKVLGRIASEVAKLLRGKHKAEFSPSVDAGDYVIVINAEKAVLTGQKSLQKTYFSSTTRPGSEKHTAYAEALTKDGAWPLTHAIKGMLPKGALGDKIITKLHVYAGAEHPHSAQKPEIVSF